MRKSVGGNVQFILQLRLFYINFMFPKGLQNDTEFEENKNARFWTGLLDRTELCFDDRHMKEMEAQST